MATVTHADIYKEVRSYLIGLFSCEVVKGFSNTSPLPIDGIVMTILSEKTFDYSSNYYEEQEDATYVSNSVEVMMQLDFYGALAGSRSRLVTNFWRNEYTTEQLKSCQPLYCNDPKNLQYINEKNQYEQRWMLEVYLQYNPEFKHEQTFLGAPIISTEKT